MSTPRPPKGSAGKVHLMRRWLARLAFSALVLSFVLFWTAFQRKQREGVSGRVVVEVVAGVLLGVVVVESAGHEQILLW